jgi:hypothetical protein
MHLKFLVIFTVISSLFMVVLPTTVSAQESCNYTKACNAGSGPNSGQQQCFGTLTSGVCSRNPRFPESCGSCTPNPTSKIYFPNQEIKQGDKVDVTVTGTPSCSTNTKLEQGQGLIDCQQTKATCSEPNPLDRNQCTFTYQCEADLDGDFQAQFSTDNSRCTSQQSYQVKKSGSKIYIEPPTQDQGEEVTIYITADEQCIDQPKVDFKDGLRIKDMEKATCTEPNPKDNKKCWWKYNAITDSSGDFTTEFLSNDPDKDFCSSEADYHVTPAQSCNSSVASGSAITNRDQVVVPYLDLRQQDTDLLSRNLLPKSLNEKLLEQSITLAQIGVREGFLGPFRSLLCQTPLVNTGAGSFCLKDLNIAGNKTDYMAKQSMALITTKSPTLSPPERKDCNLEDVNQSQGNKDLDDISQGLGTQTGFYSLGMPKVDFNTSSGEEVYPSIGGNYFTGDERAKNIKDACELYTKANYPPGVGPCPTD